MRQKLKTFLGSSLRGGQQGWHWPFGILFALLSANTLFLLARRYGFGCNLKAYDLCNVSTFYQGSVLLHSLIGILLVIALTGFAVLHIPRNFKVAWRDKKYFWTGLAVFLTLATLFGSGIYFLFNAKSASVDWLYNTHLIVAGLIVLLYFGHRALARPKQAKAIIVAGFSFAFAVAAVWSLIEASVAPKPVVPTPVAKIEAAPGEYVQPTQVPADTPFFPSPARLASGATQTESLNLLAIPISDADKIRQEVQRQGFANSVLIGAEQCVRCHADTVQQWESSAHRFSSFNNPFYVATVEYLRNTPAEPNEFIDAHLQKFGLPKEAAGKIKSRWCASCHDPLIQLSGRMGKDIDKGGVEAQAGLICLSCHAIKDIPGHTGNGNYVWNDEFTDSYIFARSADGPGATLHDLYLKANPERHKADMLKPFFRKSEYCATCHKVALEKPVNDYRWVRGQNEYDNWHNSGVAHNAARTFYLPPKTKSCQDCHMPLVDAPLGDVSAKNGKVKSHRFEAANTALPFIRGDRKMVESTERSLRDKALRLSIAGFADGKGGLVALTDGQLHEIQAQDGKLELHTVVRNTGVGHTFPGGTTDSNEGWIEVTASGPGATYSAGTLDERGYVQENTRIFNAVFVDKDGNRINKRNAHQLVAPIYVAVIPPSASDLSRYAIPLDRLGDLSQGATVKVRLLWRKFNREYTEFAFNANREGFAKFDEAPTLPITEIAAATLTIKREGDKLVAQAMPPEVKNPGELAHDYAVGLLRQGDTKLARLAARQAIADDPKSANYLRTQARVEIEEGQFQAARQTLEAAEKLAPGDPQDAWLWAQILVQEGDLQAADSACDQVLAAFPGDRMALKLKGRIAYLDGRFQDAAAVIGKVLEIDPEDSTAHYYAMLAHRALGNADEEKKEHAAYQYHKADETAQQATLAFRQNDDDTNFASQKIKVFALVSAQPRLVR
jgi:tetratricopeptide (TPR) repeat protein